MELDKEQGKEFWDKMNKKLNLRETEEGELVYNANPGFMFATEILDDMGFGEDEIREILNNLSEHGAYSDGEIMLNCEDYLLRK